MSMIEKNKEEVNKDFEEVNLDFLIKYQHIENIDKRWRDAIMGYQQYINRQLEEKEMK